MLTSSFRSTLGNGRSGRPLPPLLSSELVVHRDKGQSLVFTISSLLCHSQRSASALQHRAGLCTFAAGVRRPLSSDGHSKLSDRNPKGVDPPLPGHALPHVSQCKCGKIGAWSLSHGPPCASTCTWASSTRMRCL